MRDPRGCGLIVDCPRTYNLSAINESISLWDPTNAAHAATLQAKRAAAAAVCTSKHILPSGAWCLRRGAEKHGTRRVELSNGMSYTMPGHHVQADAIIVDVLHRLLLRPGGRRLSINDFGAGVGQYGRALLSLDPSARWRGFDGSGDCESYTSGFVSFIDLTMPLSLPRAHWVLLLEVGEHVPSRDEGVLIRNAHAHNHCGVILSWAHLWQSGHRHINNHAEDYLVKIFDGLGYRLDARLTAALRDPARRRDAGPGRAAQAAAGMLPGGASGPIYDYFARNAMAFARVQPTSRECMMDLFPVRGTARRASRQHLHQRQQGAGAGAGAGAMRHVHT